MSIRAQLLVLVLAMSAVGCESVPLAVDKAADAQDKAVSASVFVLCQGASVGAIRRYFGSEAGVQVWRDLCSMRSEFEL